MPQTLKPPFMFFLDEEGLPLDGGQIYIGQVNQNPETNPVAVYYDLAMTLPAAQPVRTVNGYPSINGKPTPLYCATDCSVTVKNKRDELVLYLPNINDPVLALRSELAASTGSELIGDGTGTVAEKLASAVTEVDLAASGGAAMVGYGSHLTVASRLNERVSIKYYGAKGDGTTDDLAAFQSARTAVGANGTVYLPGPATYYFAGSRPDLTGCNIYADQGVTVKVDENPNSKDMKLVRPLTVQNTVTALTITKPANVLPNPEMLNLAAALDQINVDEVTSVVDMSTWLHKRYTVATGDVSVAGSGTLTSSALSWPSDIITSPQLLINTALTTGALYELNVSNTSGSSERVGFFVRSTASSRIHVVVFPVGVPTITHTVLDFTGAVVSTTNYTMPNGGAYGFVSNQEINLGVVARDSSNVTLLANGLPILNIPVTWSEAGFYIGTEGDATKIVFKDMLATTGYKIRSKKPLNIGVIGDSISYGAWASQAIEQTLPIALQNFPWAGDVVVTNYAVSGTDTAYWVTETATMDFSAHDVVVCMLGTNDQQGGVTVPTYTDNLTTIKNQVTADGPEMVFAIFPIFTSKAVTGTGVTTGNYAYHAKYTHALKKWCVSNNVQYGDVRRNFGVNLNWYMDNIHPTVEGHIAYLSAIVEGLGKLLKNRNYYFGW